MKSFVKQVKGPGMNRGMKKPRKKPAQPKEFTPPSYEKNTKATETSSYLSDQLFAKGGKVQAMRNGKGKHC